LDFIKENTGRNRTANSSGYMRGLVSNVSGENGGQIEGKEMTAAADIWHKKPDNVGQM
jgi:phage tail sheath protein FI